MRSRTNDRFEINVARMISTTLLESDYSLDDLRRAASLFQQTDFCNRIYLAIEDYAYNLEPKKAVKPSKKPSPQAQVLESESSEVLAIIRKKKLSRKAVTKKILKATSGSLPSMDPDSMSMEQLIEDVFINGSDDDVANFVDDVAPSDNYLNYIGKR